MKLEAGSRGVKKQVKYRGGENDCQGVSLNVNFFLSYLCKGWIELMSQLDSILAQLEVNSKMFNSNTRLEDFSTQSTSTCIGVDISMQLQF